ncbi:MAG: Isoleucine--tRNA ligase [Calditrichaeota bacterium]|nr:Isoleucine--tRNA ligase [Calditrichota bacterium]
MTGNSNRKPFSPVPNPPDFPRQDHEVLEFWERERIFERSIEQRAGRDDYVFYDGPPGTNGPPHIGHLMQSALKDVWPRFWTMRGKRVLRKAGWDTHGLPIELTADRDLDLHSKPDIEAYGVQRYIDYCRETVFRFKGEWEQAIRRIGRFLDMEDFYATYTNQYIQSDWWVLRQAWNTKVRPEFADPTNLIGGDRFLYKDYRVSAWCPTQGTTLSNFEVAQGYREISEIALYVKMPVAGMENTSLVVWTTTAWTLLSNIAVAVGPELTYVRLRVLSDSANGLNRAGERLIVAKSRLDALDEFLGGADNYEIETTIGGRELAGMNYRPLWEFQQLAEHEHGHFVIGDEYVTAEDGTGLVHLAPYGEDDYRLIKQQKLDITLRVNERGEVVEGEPEWVGRWFKDDELEIEILKNLAQRNLLFAKEKHTHTYPFNYKTETPLIYFPRPGWFIRATAMREEMLEANRRINWIPDYIRGGRFGKWLENVIDWNITRERYWGSPLPVWTSADGGRAVVIESIRDLNRYVVREGEEPFTPDADIHKPRIDRIVLHTEDGVELRREDFVLDSWFNAGIMPWGQCGYPDAPGSAEYFNSQYPADFICEGLDQTRGWFYSLLAASTLLAIARADDDVGRWSSYRNVICTNLVLSEEGEKMSKSRGNVVHPIPVMEKYGADAVRWSFFRNNPWLPIRFGEEPLQECLRQVHIPLWNAYAFFVTYANVDGWDPAARNEMADPTPLDRWIVTCVNDLVAEVTRNLEQYDIMPASGAITDFIDRLTNWYIRRSRRRFWKSEQVEDKNRAYHTLYTMLATLSRVLAPFAPFITETIHRNLVAGHLEGAADSVHLDEWPELDDRLRDDDLKARMDYVRQIVSAGRAAREKARMKVRQPLPRILVVAEEPQRERMGELTELLLDELNVRELEFVDSENDLVSFRAKANFPQLGPRFGKATPEWAAKIAAADAETAAAWAGGATVTIDGERFAPDDVVLSREAPAHLVVHEDGEIMVALDTRLDDSLRREGYVRELINKIQNRRKQHRFEITQRIELSLAADEELRAAVEQYHALIEREVLATRIELEDVDGTDELIQVNDKRVKLALRPVATDTSPE